jgi:hypothetical protein
MSHTELNQLFNKFAGREVDVIETERTVYAGLKKVYLLDDSTILPSASSMMISTSGKEPDSIMAYTEKFNDTSYELDPASERNKQLISEMDALSQKECNVPSNILLPDQGVFFDTNDYIDCDVEKGSDAKWRITANSFRLR